MAEPKTLSAGSRTFPARQMSLRIRLRWYLLTSLLWSLPPRFRRRLIRAALRLTVWPYSGLRSQDLPPAAPLPAPVSRYVDDVWFSYSVTSRSSGDLHILPFRMPPARPRPSTFVDPRMEDFGFLVYCTLVSSWGFL